MEPVSGSGDFRGGRPETVGRFLPLVAHTIGYKDGKRAWGRERTAGHSKCLVASLLSRQHVCFMWKHRSDCPYRWAKHACFTGFQSQHCRYCLLKHAYVSEFTYIIPESTYACHSGVTRTDNCQSLTRSSLIRQLVAAFPGIRFPPIVLTGPLVRYLQIPV